MRLVPRPGWFLLVTGCAFIAAAGLSAAGRWFREVVPARRNAGPVPRMPVFVGAAIGVAVLASLGWNAYLGSVDWALRNSNLSTSVANGYKAATVVVLALGAWVVALVAAVVIPRRDGAYLLGAWAVAGGGFVLWAVGVGPVGLVQIGGPVWTLDPLAQQDDTALLILALVLAMVLAVALSGVLNRRAAPSP